MAYRINSVCLIVLILILSSCNFESDGQAYSSPSKQLDMPSKVENVACVDSDELDYFSKGYIINQDGSRSDDECVQKGTKNYLLEYICTDNSAEPSQGIFVECPGDCVDGACQYSQCLLGECCFDIDCDDSIFYTVDNCFNENDEYDDGTSAAQCLNTPQLVGNRNINLLVVEFSPADIQYDKLYYCYNSINGYYLQDRREYCDNIISQHSYLDVLHNPTGLMSFDTSNEGTKNIYSFYYINEYLREEANRWGISEIPYFTIDIHDPIVLDDLPPFTTLENISYVDDYFEEKITEHNIDLSPYDLVVVVYFNDYDGLSLTKKNSFTSHNSGNIIFVSTDTFRIYSDPAPHTLVHEILHSFGAKDYYVGGESGLYDWCTMFDCCTNPYGVPIPNMFPQVQGCVMCAGGAIVLSLGQEQISPSDMFQDVIICGKTAEEIGWGKYLYCDDGTPSYECSNNKPYYCEKDILLQRADICGCSKLTYTPKRTSSWEVSCVELPSNENIKTKLSS